MSLQRTACVSKPVVVDTHSEVTDTDSDEQIIYSDDPKANNQQCLVGGTSDSWFYGLQSIWNNANNTTFNVISFILYWFNSYSEKGTKTL